MHPSCRQGNRFRKAEQPCSHQQGDVGAGLGSGIGWLAPTRCLTLGSYSGLWVLQFQSLWNGALLAAAPEVMWVSVESWDMLAPGACPVSTSPRHQGGCAEPRVPVHITASAPPGMFSERTPTGVFSECQVRGCPLEHFPRGLENASKWSGLKNQGYRGSKLHKLTA